MLFRLSTLLVGLALATTPARPAPPDPLDARSTTKALQHRSAFDGYRRHGADQPMDWRQANDNVGRIGGWRSYAREAAATPTSPPTTTPTSTPASAPASGPPVAPGHRH